MLLVSRQSSIALMSVCHCVRRSVSSFVTEDSDILVITKKNGVTTLRFNQPDKLNGLTAPMLAAIATQLRELADCNDTKVAVLTGTDPYYSAGVYLNELMRPALPATIHERIVQNNQTMFDLFLDFPKPILVAVNGPAIGACVTSAMLCDGIIASEKATFHTPFVHLGITPEGCSSVHFERVMGKKNARRMLEKGWKPTAEEALEAGIVMEVVPHEQLMDRAQATAERWAHEGKVRGLVAAGAVSEYKAINARESVALADAFLGLDFLRAQIRIAFARRRFVACAGWQILRLTRPLWRRLLP